MSDQSQNDQSSSSAASKSAASASAASGDAAASAAPTRPDWVPDAFWDAKDGVKGGDLRKQFDDLTAFKAEQDVRRATVPADANGYKLELPADHKLPDGVEGIEWDEKDPLMAQARAFAHAAGIDQAGFSQLLGMYATAKTADLGAFEARKTEALAALGTKSAERVTNVNTWLDAKFKGPKAAALKAMLVAAPSVEAFEDIIKMTAGGGPGFNGKGREGDGNGTIPGYDKMSYAQRREAQEQLRQQRAGR